MKALWLCVLGLLTATSLLAQEQAVSEASVSASEFQRIEATRAREMAAFDAQDAECHKRFAVSGCLKSVQSRRRAVLADLKHQEATLHEREQAQQGVAQRERAAQKALERKQQEADLRADNATDRTKEKLQELKEKQAAHSTKRAASAPAAVASPAPSGPSVEQQSSNRESYARKQLDAEKKRQDVARRLAEKGGKPAAPLPIPK